MQLDDELCLCFHVTKRKVVNWVRITRPRRAAQLSECYGAGTGCGWCRPFLERIFREQSAHDATGTAAAETGVPLAVEEPTAQEYAQLRARYVRAGGGTPPPGATPIDD